MKGTFPYCRTKEAVKRMIDGDVVQNLDTSMFFKSEGEKVFASINCINWNLFNKPMAIFPPYDEWRSITNLHYLNDLRKHYSDNQIFYLTEDEKILAVTEPKADVNKKRWFVKEDK